MRSPDEILFRLRQEGKNAWIWLLPPRHSPRPAGKLPLPSPQAVRSVLDPAYQVHLLALADRIEGGEIPVFDQWIRPGGDIRWRKDYRHGPETGTVYFRRVPYLDFSRAGDHKWIWEVNRHQHLVTLAQAWCLDPKASYLRTLETQLDSWMEQNPPHRGINWASALEVAFRALSWIWIWHLAGEALPRDLSNRFLRTLFLHGLHLKANLSIYFSPNTHLLGEALALDALGRLFGNQPQWVETGSRHMAEALHRQVRPDGSHFEQSSYYHVYAFDMFLFHRILAGGGTGQEKEILGRMAAFLTALLGGQGRIPLLGDDDGGRLFSPFGPRDQFGRATMAVYHAWSGTTASAAWVDAQASSEMAAWWLATPAPAWEPPVKVSELFPSAGLAFLRAAEAEVILDGGPLGPGSGGHSHADSLQILVRGRDRSVLIDPGTYTYIADPALRERFREAAAHSTISVNGTEQAISAGPFRWKTVPRVQVLCWNPGDSVDHIAAECRYAEIRHLRWLAWEKQVPRLWVFDQVTWDLDQVEYDLEQIWRLEDDSAEVDGMTIFCAGARLALEPAGKLSMLQVWRSAHYGHRAPATAAAIRWRTASPARRVAMVDWNVKDGPVALRADWEADRVTATAGDARIVMNLTIKERESK